MKLVIGNKNYSSWSLRPWLLLKEFNLEFEEIQVSLRQENIRQRLLQYSSSARVPVLIDEDLTIWDSLSICEYVSDRYLGGNGWPEDTAARAHARSISAEMHSGFTALRNELPMNCRARRKVEISETTRREIERIDEIWSQCLEHHSNNGPWLCGRFSIADCMFAPVALRFLTYQIEISKSSRNYMSSVAGKRHIKDWITAAQQETEVLEMNETGTDV